MYAEYVKPGESLNYVNPTDDMIEPGAVIVLGSKIGIAACRIEPGELGAVATVGAWMMAKGNEAVSMGDKLYYNAESDTVTTTESGAVYAGFAAEDSDAENDVVLVALNR